MAIRFGKPKPASKTKEAPAKTKPPVKRAKPVPVEDEEDDEGLDDVEDEDDVEDAEVEDDEEEETPRRRKAKAKDEDFDDEDEVEDEEEDEEEVEEDEEEEDEDADEEEEDEVPKRRKRPLKPADVEEESPRVRRAVPPKQTSQRGESWAYYGAEAHRRLEQERRLSEEREADKDHMRRFWLRPGESGTITFLDGDLYDSGPQAGCLKAPFWHEHRVVAPGARWSDPFVCTRMAHKDEPCPICEQGDRPVYVCGLTVIDHRTVYSRDKTTRWKDEPRIYVAGQRLVPKLQKRAARYGSLAGLTYEVSRETSRDARVGDLVERVQRMPIAAVFKKYPKARLLDIATDVRYRTPKELRALGFGGGPRIGSQAAAPVDAELDEELERGGR